MSAEEREAILPTGVRGTSGKIDENGAFAPFSLYKEGKFPYNRKKEREPYFGERKKE